MTSYTGSHSTWELRDGTAADSWCHHEELVAATLAVRITADRCPFKAPCDGEAAGKALWTEANSARNGDD